jgi:hypothetical protein
VPQTWGSWFEWAAPDQAYFIDSRFELFPVDVWEDYRAMDGPGADAMLRRWGVDLVVVAPEDHQPAGGWTVVYGDPDGSILRAPDASGRVSDPTIEAGG